MIIALLFQVKYILKQLKIRTLHNLFFTITESNCFLYHLLLVRNGFNSKKLIIFYLEGV